MSKAPDKIYILTLDNGARFVEYAKTSERCDEYIRKDDLLDWAKELKGQVCSLHPNNRDATCARNGMLTIIDNIFDKLNSL